MNKNGVQHLVKYQEEISQRLDFFVAQNFGFTRSKAQKLIREGSLLVNNNKVSPKYCLQKYDEVILGEIIKSETSPKVPIIYEEDSYIVIDKPSGISVHPAPGERDKTVIEILNRKLNFKHPTFKSGVVHRLDKGTSGVMIVARNEVMQTYFQKMFKSRKVNKTYLALVKGRIIPKEGIIDLPLKRDLVQRGKIGISQSGKRAKTRYSVITQNDKYSYLEVRPETGRTHQIRVHLSTLGFPIVGDQRYGSKTNIAGRMFLHAHSLDFVHPLTNKRVKYISELSRDLKNVLQDNLLID